MPLKWPVNALQGSRTGFFHKETSLYYKNQLDQLKDSEYNKNIVISDSIGTKTKTLDLTLESIKVLIDWLNEEKSKLERKKHV